MQKRKKITKPKAIKSAMPNVDMEVLTEAQVETLIGPEPAAAEEGGNTKGGVEVEQEIKTTPTIAQIRCMGVILLHHLIRTEYPQFAELLDIAGREELQNKLIEKLRL